MGSTMRLPLIVDLATQTLWHQSADGKVAHEAISSAKNGAGEIADSYCTPRGLHCIRAKIGEGADSLAVFKRRRVSGERCTPQLYAHYAHQTPPRDWILTRILWLSGLEPHFNRLGAVDTMRRFIYLHGTPPNTPMAQPGSMGCIRLQPSAMIRLFNSTRPYDRLFIAESMESPIVLVSRKHLAAPLAHPDFAPSWAHSTLQDHLVVHAHPPLSTLVASAQLWQMEALPILAWAEIGIINGQAHTTSPIWLSADNALQSAMENKINRVLHRWAKTRSKLSIDSPSHSLAANRQTSN